MKPEVKLFNIPNLLTAGNMLSGVLCIVFVFMGKFEWAPWFIFLGAIFDFLDGLAARLFNQYSEFGKQLDSLADMITFGVAPGVIMVVVIAISIEMGSYPQGENLSEYAQHVIEKWRLGLFYDSAIQFEGYMKYLPFLGLIIPLFSLFRLAKFNIDTRQSESFIGMPTPIVTMFFATFPMALWWYFSPEGFPSYFAEVIFQPALVCSLVIVMSLSLVSEIPLFSFKFKHFGWKGNQVRYIFLLLSLILIVMTKVWAIAIIVFLYPVMSLLTQKPEIQNEEKNEI